MTVDVAALARAIDADFARAQRRTPRFAGWPRFSMQLDLCQEDLHLPPSLVTALGDLAEPLCARAWKIPMITQCALRMVCQALHQQYPEYPVRPVRPEDVRLFLDWVGIAVLEAALDG